MKFLQKDITFKKFENLPVFYSGEGGGGQTVFCGRVYCFHVRPSVRPNDRVSVTFCFFNILKNH